MTMTIARPQGAATVSHDQIDNHLKSWDDVFARWKARGPMNETYVESVQRSRSDVMRWLAGEAAA